ncbi:LysR family transcriptional regulator [Pectobacterium quasiaquaticum]|uniref:LysR family transcriptional regulator n=1 Tax=Pectobacterium quasiaquaticum TaxID=2774015 RepID=A0A9Q2IEE4_9GAMM|nr:MULTISPECIES: LysR family transcriptional regulator [Pectobacterium]PLY36754.1 LysR family transcriptional regulator [Pectobacterium carotovorum]MBE5202440.1 LysR family transcriptional regulator [Pectobacterium quasiaquaticum]MBE5209509.1 LysR family transcriptional regulator [Pectobacterium quasiaquaticum]MBE5212622.1 LysR family transcriptional regulator [Pectobacterium quasiaquaticum]MBE5222090.1 LysR family transcriptional regulator [Pectobacterium quasiaquaticum]
MNYTIGRNDLDGVVVFLAVAEERGFRAAARRLGITPSAVSQAIRAFEGRIGVTLLARTTRSVGLTEAGERLLLQVRPAAQQLLNGIESARSLGHSVTGLLRISVPRASVQLLTERFVAGFLVEHPQLQLEFVGDDRLVDIVAEGCDAGVRPRSFVHADMVAVPLTREEPQVVVGSPAFLARYGRPARPEDIQNVPCITFRQAGILLDEWVFNVDGERRSIHVSGALILDDVAASVHAAEQGVGLFRLPRSIVARNIHAGTLEVILSNFSQKFPGLALYYPSRSTVLPKLRAFVDYVLAHKI